MGKQPKRALSRGPARTGRRALLASLLVHAVAVLLLTRAPVRAPAPREESSEPIEIEVRPPEELPPEELPPEPPPAAPAGSEVAPPRSTSPAREQPTRSRHRDQHPNRASAAPAAPPQSA